MGAGALGVAAIPRGCHLSDAQLAFPVVSPRPDAAIIGNHEGELVAARHLDGAVGDGGDLARGTEVDDESRLGKALPPPPPLVPRARGPTLRGTVFVLVVPFPSCPKSFLPQVYKLREFSSAETPD